MKFGPIQVHGQLEGNEEQLVDQLGCLTPIRWDHDEIVQWKLTVVQGSELSLYERRAESDLTFSKETGFPTVEIAHLVSHYATVVREAEGAYTLHSTCVAKDGNAVLLCGANGAGKTSVSLEMSARFGYSILSTNRTLLQVREESAYVVGGTTVVTVRGSTSGERTFRLRRLGTIVLQADSPVTLTAVYFIWPWADTAFTAPVDDGAIRFFTLCSQLPRFSVLFSAAGVASWPFDSQTATLSRAAFATRLTGHVMLTDIAGSPADIATRIHKAWR